MSREFIETYYPWFLSTYDGYRYPVQRVDTVRYFILRHYGGIYLDLDNVSLSPFPAPNPSSIPSLPIASPPSIRNPTPANHPHPEQGCVENLTPLLYYPTWVTDGARGALSNNIIASTPQHPFWILLTDSLIPYNWNYFFPYVTISYASGQWFETAIWETYHAMIQKPRWRGGARPGQGQAGGAKAEEQEQEEDELKPLHRIIIDDRPGTEPWIFFTHRRGGTWTNWDNAFFLWIGDHLILLGTSVIALVGVTFWGVRACVRRGRGKGYKRVAHDV
jgi:hypothetical protein